VRHPPSQGCGIAQGIDAKRQGASTGPRSGQQQYRQRGANQLQSQGEGSAASQIILMNKNGIDGGGREEVPGGIFGARRKYELAAFAFQATSKT